MLFLISCVLAVISFFAAFFNITVESFTDHPTHQKVLRWVLAIVFTGSIVTAFGEYSASEKSNKEQHSTILQLKIIDSTSGVRIDSLSKSNERYHFNTVKILAEYGLKVDSIGNKIEKIKTNKQRTPANIGPINGNSGVVKRVSGDTTWVDVIIANSGESPASHFYAKIYLLIRYKGVYYRPMRVFGEFNNQVVSERDGLKLNQWYDKKIYYPFIDGAEEFYIIDGEFTDEDKNKIKVNFSYSYDVREKDKCSIYNEQAGLMKILKISKKLYK